MRQRSIDVVISIVASVIALLLSQPYWRDFAHWSESLTTWRVYFAVAFVLCVYVFYVFLRVVHTLFEHDAIERAERAATGLSDLPPTRLKPQVQQRTPQETADELP